MEVVSQISHMMISSHTLKEIGDKSPLVVPDAGDFLRQKFNLPHDAEVSLSSLSNPPEGQRPSYTLPCLVLLAIYGSTRKMLTLQEIYAAIEERFEWYRLNSEEKKWKYSIRHNLSLNILFRKRAKPETEPGVGHYWYIDISDGEGYKRERKRGSTTSIRQTTSLQQDFDNMSDDERNTMQSSGFLGFDCIDPSLL